MACYTVQVHLHMTGSTLIVIWMPQDDALINFIEPLIYARIRVWYYCED